MPEGDTIFKLAAYLAPALSGRQVVAGLAQAKPTANLAGLGIRNVHATGKHLFIAFDNGELLRNHLGMWGSWHSYRPSERWLRPRHRASIVIDVGGIRGTAQLLERQLDDESLHEYTQVVISETDRLAALVDQLAVELAQVEARQPQPLGSLGHAQRQPEAMCRS